MAVFGIQKISKEFFNKQIGKITFVICIFNPIFFGHMGMNPKDPIVFTALIWTIYFFNNYLENLEGSRFKHLIFLSLIMGFGTSIRVTFIALLIPLF